MEKTPIEELDTLRTEEDALDQSVALNRIVMAMLESRKRADFWLRIILLVSILANIVIATVFLGYESQFTTTETTTTTTVEQDTGEGSGNNVYQAGENATYTQEEVSSDGQADNNQNNDNQNQIS